MESDHLRSIPITFAEIARQRGTKVAIRHKDMGLWKEITWTQYYDSCHQVAHALISFGIQPGDFVGVIGENSPEWLFIDLGIQMAGARTVGIYTTSAWQQVKYILQHSECKFLFAENEEQVDKWLEMQEDLPLVQKVVYWEKKGLERLNHPQLIYYEDFMMAGKSHQEQFPNKVEERSQLVDPDDIAILVYTSGTTGLPKGAMITGKNLLWVAHALIQDKSDQWIGADAETMSFLPLCHIFERMFSVYLPMVLGYTVNMAEGADTIAQNLREIRPTIGYGVPRVWEKFQSNILIKMTDAPWFNRWVFNAALNIASRYTTKKLAGEKINWSLRTLRFLAYWSVLYPLKYMVGINRMRYAFSGAAPISPKVLHFYHTLGITMFEGYGMTETSCIISASTPQHFKLGTVGKPIAGAEVRIADDGEILVRHPGVVSGYYRNPEATKEALEDGWLHTGDLGSLDEEGYLKIIDRKKDLIITAGGKNIAPQMIENKLKFSPYINDAIVIGDGRKFISAIIVLDEENVNKYARDQLIQYSAYSELAAHPAIRKLIEAEVQLVNKELARVQSVRKFTILDKRLYVEDGEVTPTMKVKRKFINDEYKDLIEAMYS